MLHEEELTVEIKLVTTVYAEGEAVLVVEEVLERVGQFEVTTVPSDVE